MIVCVAKSLVQCELALRENLIACCVKSKKTNKHVKPYCNLQLKLRHQTSFRDYKV